MKTDFWNDKQRLSVFITVELHTTVETNAAVFTCATFEGTHPMQSHFLKNQDEVGLLRAFRLNLQSKPNTLPYRHGT